MWGLAAWPFLYDYFGKLIYLLVPSGWVLRGGNVKNHPVIPCVSSMLMFKLRLKHLHRGVVYLQCFWPSETDQGARFWSLVLGQLDEEHVSGLSSYSVVTAAYGISVETTCMEEECKRYHPLFKTHSELLNALISAVSPVIALVYSTSVPYAIFTYIFQKYVNTN